MFNHWVLPVGKQTVLHATALPSGYLGAQIDFYQGTEGKLPKGGVVLIGTDPVAADQVRERLYAFANPVSHSRITDLGNLRKGNSDFGAPLIQELLAAGHIVVLIGSNEDTGIMQYLAYRDFKRLSNLAVIDNQLTLKLKDVQPTDASVWQQILQPQHKRLFHFSLFGAQAHLMQPQVTKYMDKKGFDVLRLGALRNDLAAAEPALRDMDMVAVNLRALRTPTPTGLSSGASSGLTVEEICQLGRYAGMSEKISSLSVTGLFLNSEIDAAYHTDAAAQLIWYFLEGAGQRHGDFPVSVHGMTEYIVDLQKMAYKLTFWRSQKSGRWWVQVPVMLDKNKERHRLVPCTYQDYQLAGQEELSDRLMKAFERFM